MHPHRKREGSYRTNVYFNAGQAELIIQEVSELKNSEDNEIQKKTYSGFFVDLWVQYRECKSLTGLNIRQLVKEYLRLKALCKP